MSASRNQADFCCVCGQPRGLAQRRESWGLKCPTALIPRSANPEHRPWQITNDVIYSAGVWRNGGADEKTHICDECLRIGLREIKLHIDELLGSIEADHDKDKELAELTQRLARVQHYHQSLAYAHDRMQGRLAKLLEVLPAKVVAENKEAVRTLKWEASRGTAIKETDDYLFKTTPEEGASPAGV